MGSGTDGNDEKRTALEEGEEGDRQGGEGLARELNAPLLTVYGAGTILGAGIYVLIGEIVGVAGYWAPLAFLLAAVVAGVNGLVYAELATRSPNAGGPSDYVERAFGRRAFTVLIGWMIVATGVVSGATITTGFAGYLGQFVGVPEWLAVAGLLLTLGAVAAAGAEESAWFMAATTTLGVAGLLFVMGVGYLGSPDTGLAGVGELVASLPPLGDLATLTALLTASFLAVYAFIGFEDMVHMAEEVKEPGRSIPLAIVVAIGVAMVFYVLVSVAVLLVLEPSALAGRDAPLVAVVEAAGYPGWPLTLLSLWIILNGALAQIIMATRVIYSLGRSHGGAPGFLARVDPLTDTPLAATGLATLTALVLALFFPLAALASATSFIMLLVFAASNAALIVLERRDPEAPFDVPKLVPWIGLILSLALAAGQLATGGGH